MAAAEFLRKRDDMVSIGQQPHRVTEYFAGHASDSLRPAMERWAATGEVSEQLSAELRANAMCKLDDTWAEAAHRDISHIGKRAASSKVPHTAASQRLEQNLAMADSLDDRGQRYFHRAYRQWKAIGQRTAKRSKWLRPRRMSDRKVKQMVYRYDKAALRSWGGSGRRGQGRADSKSVAQHVRSPAAGVAAGNSA